MTYICHDAPPEQCSCNPTLDDIKQDERTEMDKMELIFKELKEDVLQLFDNYVQTIQKDLFDPDAMVMRPALPLCKHGHETDHYIEYNLNEYTHCTGPTT